MKQFNLEEITRSIIEKYDWLPPSEWTNFHFKELSRDIENATGDRISEETLKRIFGKRRVDSDNYQPQAYSQMALIKFTDSLNKSSLSVNINLKKVKGYLKITTPILVGVITITILLFSFLKKSGNFAFSCENPVDALPFTARFSYDISGIKDSVFAIFEAEEEAYLPPNKSQINFFYKKAGKHRVRFHTRHKMLDSIDIVANTHEWQGGYFPNNEPDLFEPFINQSFFRKQNYFYATPDKLIEEEVDLRQRFYTAYKFFAPFNESLDSLTLEAKLLNNAETGSYLCYDIGLSLVSESGLIDFKFTQPKCSRHAFLNISEKHFDGEYDDLSALSVDMSDWLQIKMITKKNNFNLFLSDELIFSEPYEKPLGNLLGIIIYFYGSGKIDDLEIKNHRGETFYQNDFSH